MVETISKRLAPDAREHWLWQVERAVLWARTHLVGQAVAEYAPGESGGGRSRLAAVRATVHVGGYLPPLGRGMHLEATEGSLWLFGPGDEPAEPLEEVLEEVLDPATARLLVLPELIAQGEGFLADRTWATLHKRYWADAARCRVDGRGVHVTFHVHLEAE